MAYTYRVPSASLICILVTGCDWSIGVGAAVVRMLALVSCSFEWLNFTSGAGLKNNTKKNCPSSPSLLLVWRQCLYRLRAGSYFSDLQSYSTNNARAAINEGVNPKRKNKRLLALLCCLGTTKLSRLLCHSPSFPVSFQSLIVASLYAFALAVIRIGRNFNRKGGLQAVYPPVPP